jgi:hypothetical protein
MPTPFDTNDPTFSSFDPSKFASRECFLSVLNLLMLCMYFLAMEPTIQTGKMMFLFPVCFVVE